ncbi:hypothetical protein ACT7CW_03285 [Bacillus pacificus]
MNRFITIGQAIFASSVTLLERLVVFATDGIIKQEYLPFHTTETLDNHAAHSLITQQQSYNPLFARRDGGT